jgi:hypothetical protein
LVYLVTGRMETQRQITTSSLKSAGVLFDKLLMNKVGRTPEEQLQSKKDNVAPIADKVVKAFDDNPQAKELYKGFGIPVG